MDRDPAHGPVGATIPDRFGARVLALRADGESHDEIGERFRRGPKYIRQVEGLAHYTQGLELLS